MCFSRAQKLVWIAEMERGDGYKFDRIADARNAINHKVNLIGVVLETSIPKHSRGTDYYCTLRIVDESNPSQGVAVNVFHENLENLPHVKSAGDIIQFSRVQMKINAGNVYAMYSKKSSAFALFEGKCGTTYDPYQASHRFQSSEQDKKKFIDELRKWAASNHLDGGTPKALSLREIKFGTVLNVMCKVLHVCNESDDGWIAYIWDGTDTPASAVKNNLQDEMDNPIPLQLEQSPLPRDVLCSFPTVGSVVRVVIVDQQREKFDLKFLKAGNWVVFVSIIFENEAGLWGAMLLTNTKLRFLSADDPDTTELQRNYEQRLCSKWGRMPLSFFPCYSHVTETDHGDVAFVTLMDIVTSSEVTAKFRCVARAVAVLPGRADQFRDPRGILRIRLTLDDPTARIHAYVYAEDGEMFFGPNCSTDIIEKMRKKLLGVVTNGDGKEMEEAPREPPWFACCIKSYYLDENDQRGTRKYRIFGTRVVNY